MSADSQRGFVDTVKHFPARLTVFAKIDLCADGESRFAKCHLHQCYLREALRS